MYLESIGQRARLVDGWRLCSQALIVRFEDLVGEKGGGTREQQRHEIMRVVKFLNLEVSEDMLEEIQKSLFGMPGRTFRKGQAGGWRDVLDEALLDVYYRYDTGMTATWGYDA